MRIAILLIFLNFVVGNVFAVTHIKNMRVWPAPDGSKVVLDLSKDVKYKLFTLEKPNRVVIDLQNSVLKKQISDINIKNTGIRIIRAAKHDNNTRVVLELSNDLTLKAKHFILKPYEQYGYRLVIDLAKHDKISQRDEVLALFGEDYKAATAIRSNTSKRKQKFNIAIDPGHGGPDPGAIGPRGTYEKTITLAIAKRLKSLIDREPNMQGFLIRSGDYYVGLRQRVAKSRKYNADIFISIHADAARNKKAIGASIYTLSERGASSEAAKWLADKQNRSDLLGGVKLDNKGDLLASVLLDLSQSSSKRESGKLANSLLQSLCGIVGLHKKNVEKAGFAVLKAPDIPSVLVEAGFISNYKMESKLKNSKYQDKLARSLLQGIKRYYAANKALY